MTTINSYFSHHISPSLRLISVLILAGCALLLGLRVQVNHSKTIAPANPLPDLHGQAAVEHLKQDGIYDTLAEAVAAARYNADPLPSPGAYQFSNPAQGLRATFTSSGARVVSSPGGRARELTIKLIGYGYGSRMTNLDSRNIVARRNRIEHEYSQSAIPESQSAIKEWFVNSEAGIEHGFTLPEPPPTERGGDEALRVEMEISGDYEPRLDATGQAVSFACGRSGGELTYNKLRVYDARNREVAARFELDGKRLAIVVEDGESEYPVTIDPLFSQQAKLTVSAGAAGDFFGVSVAISGDTVVVGEPFATIDDRIEKGAAYIFVRNTTTTPPSWIEQAKLTASGGEEFDIFGLSVAIDGDTVVVGAPRDSNDTFFGPGAAYIFVRDATTTPPSWPERAKLTNSTGEQFDSFGGSVAISGDTVVVGAPGAIIDSGTDRGAAYIFVRDATTSPPTWPERAKLTAMDGASFENFGESVAIDGDAVVVGAPFATVDGKIEQGAAYIFVRDTTTTAPSWPQQAKLTARDGAGSDIFGLSVAIDGDRVVVGSAGADVGTNEDQGAAYVFVPNAVATVSAASYTPLVTAKEIVAGFGLSLANTIAFATSQPLPTSLEGTSVRVKDSAGIERPAGLFFVSPLQINYQIPAGTALGAASVSVFIDQALVAVGSMQIVTTAPSIFTVGASGSGPAAALDAITFQPAPFNARQDNGSPNFIAVYGTGLGEDATDIDGVSVSVDARIDGIPVTVTYAGRAPFFIGLNQFNIQLPDGISSGQHRLRISRGGVLSNLVTITIR